MTDIPFGMYIHIPFCLKKCGYCDFYSVTDFSLQEKYISALCKHLESFSREKPSLYPQTVYIGGGTPTAVDALLLNRLLKHISSCFDISRVMEYTVETNPATIDAQKLEVLASNHVNRLSIGMQSSSDSELSALSRIHTYSDFLYGYSLSRKYIDNINVDIMAGIPGQTSDSLDRTVKNILSLKPEHISVYLLRIERETPFYRMRTELLLPDDDTCADMYLSVSSALEKSGYVHYEISNFALPGKEAIHNTSYWKRKPYVGFGPSAHSSICKTRYSYKKNIYEYINAVLSGVMPPLDEYSVLTEKDAVNEEIMLSLRLSEGLDLPYFKEKTGYDILEENRQDITEWISAGLASMNNGVFRLTDRGFAVSNYIISGLLL